MAHKPIVNKQGHAVGEKAHQMYKQNCCHYGKCHNPCSQLYAYKQEHSVCFWPVWFRTECAGLSPAAKYHAATCSLLHSQRDGEEEWEKEKVKKPWAEIRAV